MHMLGREGGELEPEGDNHNYIPVCCIYMYTKYMYTKYYSQQKSLQCLFSPVARIFCKTLYMA